MENHAKVIGVDPYMNSMGALHLPNTYGDLRFITEDLWETVEQVGPKYSEKTQAERKKLLDTIREEYAKGPIFEHFSIGSFGAQMGDPYTLNSEIERLQELSKISNQPSPVDLVLCSFMPNTVDLTVPIRDGINPKGIVYVRPTNGMSGAGDYFLEALNENAEEISLSPNTAISYNPGKYYRTLARWPTHQRNNWSYYLNPPRFRYVFDAEVVIQLRDDVNLDNVHPVRIEEYNFDKELETAFSKSSELEEFFAGIKNAHLSLFGKKIS